MTHPDMNLLWRRRDLYRLDQPRLGEIQKLRKSIVGQHKANVLTHRKMARDQPLARSSSTEQAKKLFFSGNNIVSSSSFIFKRLLYHEFIKLSENIPQFHLVSTGIFMFRIASFILFALAASASDVVQIPTGFLAAGPATTLGATDYGIIKYTSALAVDSTFNGDGRLLTNLQSKESTAQMVVSGSKIYVIGGDTGVSPAKVRIGRFNADGTLDTTFGTTGYVSLTHPTSDQWVGQTISVTAAGDLLIGGISYSTGDSDRIGFLTKISSAGVRDATFGTPNASLGGAIQLNTWGNTTSLVLMNCMGAFYLTTGKVLGVYSSNTISQIRRYSATGVVDNTYDIPLSHTARAALSLSDDSLVIAGHDATHLLVHKISPSGSDATDFGSASYVRVTFPGTGTPTYTSYIPYCLAQSISGDFYIGGLASHYVGGTLTNTDGFVWKMTSAGVVDTAFGTSGIAIVETGHTYDRIDGLVINIDGTVVATGVTGTLGSSQKYLIAKLTTAGVFDTTYHAVGWTETTGGGAASGGSTTGGTGAGSTTTTGGSSTGGTTTSGTTVGSTDGGGGGLCGAGSTIGLLLAGVLAIAMRFQLLSRRDR